MSEETKRLLKCDLIYVFKDIWVFALVLAGLWLWCYLLYDTSANAVLLVNFITGVMLLSENVRDWQVQIRMYVSTSMSRKVIFRVLNIRNAILLLMGLFIETVIAFAAYPAFGSKFLVVSGAFLLFIWGFGEIAGVLVYQRKKLGQVLMCIGYILVMSPCMGSFFLGNELSGFWRVLFDGITGINVLVFGAAAMAVLAGGICFAGKHMGEYMVY